MSSGDAGYRARYVAWLEDELRAARHRLGILEPEPTSTMPVPAVPHAAVGDGGPDSGCTCVRRDENAADTTGGEGPCGPLSATHADQGAAPSTPGTPGTAQGRSGPPVECGCARCDAARRAALPWPERLTGRRMILCPQCGNKRCPRAAYHGNDCTGSNDYGQPGSDYVREEDR